MAGRGRSTADDLLAAALAAGQSLKDAAAAAHMGERTAHRRAALPEFQAEVRMLRRAMVEEVVGRLNHYAKAAAFKLAALLASTDERIALGAATNLLNLVAKFRAEDVEALVAALEARLGELEAKTAKESP